MSRPDGAPRRLPRLLVALASEESGGTIRVSLESYLHFANELAFDLEDLVEDHLPRTRSRRRSSSGAEFGAPSL